MCSETLACGRVCRKPLLGADDFRSLLQSSRGSCASPALAKASYPFADSPFGNNYQVNIADLNEQAADRLACIVSQMQEAEGVTEELKARDQLAWVGGMNSIRSRAEEIILSEMIFV